MTQEVEKPAIILATIQSKVLLSDNNEIHVVIRDFFENAKNKSLKVNEVTTILNLLQKNKIIKVIGAFQAKSRNYTFPLPSLFSHFSVSEYDFDELEVNSFDENTGFRLIVKTTFYEYLTNFVNSELGAKEIVEPNSKLQKILLPASTIDTIGIKFAEKPFVWHCPIDRSKVGEINSKEDVETYLNKFAKSEFPHCKDRRHQNRFWIDGETISFGTIPLPISGVLKDDSVKI